MGTTDSTGSEPTTRMASWIGRVDGWGLKTKASDCVVWVLSTCYTGNVRLVTDTAHSANHVMHAANQHRRWSAGQLR